MTTQARLLLAGLLAGLTLVGLGAAPAAASCAEPSVDFLDGSDVAFSGVVTERRTSGDDLVVTVKVDRAFKGDVRRRVDVVSRAQQEDAITADDGDRVVVFGTLVDGEVSSNGCSTIVAPGRYYREVLADLGEGTTPPAGHLRADRGLGLSYDQFRTGRAVLGVLGLAVMGFVAVRWWRARRRTT
ncbi:hypothetical protein [Nocardioides currus]|uniref:DNA-binding protein n=1 Tax=Nocardioides currus TaxID=2133958 RepID=A0A2R7Z3M7_9ACTN|nr:hypothetical protein [Nocardioides currus]PUA82959.1 hypothetical protein C7S10_04545 [Nocardioides currus]